MSNCRINRQTLILLYGKCGVSDRIFKLKYNYKPLIIFFSWKDINEKDVVPMYLDIKNEASNYRKYSSVPNRRACTFINFEKKIPPIRPYFGLHVYWFWGKIPPCTFIPSCTFIDIGMFKILWVPNLPFSWNPLLLKCPKKLT